MATREFVLYQGEKFWIQTTGRYFQSGRKSAPERLLHRRIWIDANGPISDGMHVHHKDGDWRNNTLSNLELVSRSEHASQHMLVRWQNPEEAASMRVALGKAIDAARGWHSTDEGREWHSQNAKNAWKGKEPKECSCVVCSGIFTSLFPTRAKFCSKKCTQAYYYQNARVESECVFCKSKFSRFKYRDQECCSYDCAAKLRSERDKGVQPDA